jgi:hypothetical protein
MLLEKLKKPFGGIELTWPKLIAFAVAAGAYTAGVAIIPALKYTSFHTIAETFEVWIFFGIFIIMNSASNKDAALKCFVFFLISQPLIYLLQVPFSWQGWNLFSYYPRWFIWTVLCLPMGFIGYYMKKQKWWGYLILLPMILLTAYSYYCFFYNFQFSYPRYLLIVLFCAAAVFVYPLAIFESKKIRVAGTVVAAVLIVALTVLRLLDPPVYTTHLLGGKDEIFDDSYTVYLEDDSYGDVKIEQIGVDGGEPVYLVRADFKKAGHTTLTLVSPDGEAREYDLTIEQTTYNIERKNADG